MTKWQTLVPKEQVTVELQEKLDNYFKVYLLEILTIIEEVPVEKQYLDYVAFMAEVLRND